MRGRERSFAPSRLTGPVGTREEAAHRRLPQASTLQNSHDMTGDRLFEDRREAGQRLAAALDAYRGVGGDAIVVGLPRGGVVVADQVARALGASLDVCVVKKIGAPLQPELGLGALAEGGELYLDQRMIAATGTSGDDVARIVAERDVEIGDQVRRLRQARSAVDVTGKIVIVVDDGIATGGTARAVLRALRKRGAAVIVLAVPVGAASTLRELSAEADAVVCPNPEVRFHSVGMWYRRFDQVPEREVIALLEQAWSEGGRPQVPVRAGNVTVRVTDTDLEGDFAVPAGARGIVIFAHGSGSSRASPRNQTVARVLEQAGFATLLFDLLTPHEEAVDRAAEGQLRFDIPLLARRLGDATTWVRRQREVVGLPIGYFGASTGASAALVAAAENPNMVRAVVSRGGRPDLAGEWLRSVRAATLLLVGSRDPVVLELNREALDVLDPPKRLTIVHGATHLFDEPGALDEVARYAAEWFVRHLAVPRPVIEPRAHR